jgi:hypothetical protein
MYNRKVLINGILLFSIFIVFISCGTYRLPKKQFINNYVWESVDFNPMEYYSRCIVLKITNGSKIDSIFDFADGFNTILLSRKFKVKKYKYYVYNKIVDWDTIQLTDSLFEILSPSQSIFYSNEVDSIWHLGKCRFISHYFSEGYLKSSVDDKKIGHIIYLLYKSKIALYYDPIQRLLLPLQYPNK